MSGEASSGSPGPSPVRFLRLDLVIEDSEQKLLMVFVADSSDTCGSRSPLSGFPIGRDLSIQFFWLGTSSEGLGEVRAQLQDLGFTDVKFRKVGTKKELKVAVKQTMGARSPTPSTEPTTSNDPTESTLGG